MLRQCDYCSMYVGFARLWVCVGHVITVAAHVTGACVTTMWLLCMRLCLLPLKTIPRTAEETLEPCECVRVCG